jgi:hypothetical protein
VTHNVEAPARANDAAIDRRWRDGLHCGHESVTSAVEVVAVKRLIRLSATLLVISAVVGFWPQLAAANSMKAFVVHLHARFVDRHSCPFDIRVHEFGTFRNADYYDNTGFHYKTLLTAGGGKLTFTETAKGTTLTMQNQPYLVVIKYNADGSTSSVDFAGPVFKFTVPGGGVVLLDTGRLVFDGDFNVTFEAGPHQQLHGDFDAFCAAFG